MGQPLVRAGFNDPTQARDRFRAIGKTRVERRGREADEIGPAEIRHHPGFLQRLAQAPGVGVRDRDVTSADRLAPRRHHGEPVSGQFAVNQVQKEIRLRDGLGAQRRDATGLGHDLQRSQQRREGKDVRGANLETRGAGGGFMLRRHREAAVGPHAPPAGEAGWASGVTRMQEKTTHRTGAGVEPFVMRPHREGADFAVWSHYKWLNAGPGSVGGYFLNPRHDGRPPGLAGWWGVRPDRRFAMASEHEPAAGAAGLQIGTPHILSLAPLLGSLEIVQEAGGIAPLRAKSLAQTDLLLALIDRELAGHGFTVVTPRGHPARGGHVALAHPEARRICQALKAAGVVPDFRGPDLIRLAPSPLFTRFADCAEAVSRLRRIVETGAHLQLPEAPTLVP